MSRAGALSSYIEVEAFTETVSTTGEPVKTWSRFCRAWAQVRSTDTTERFQSDRDVGPKLKRFIMRYRADITFKQRILFKDEYYNIRSIMQVEKYGRDKFMEILGEVVESGS